MGKLKDYIDKSGCLNVNITDCNHEISIIYSYDKNREINEKQQFVLKELAKNVDVVYDNENGLVVDVGNYIEKNKEKFKNIFSACGSYNQKHFTHALFNMVAGDATPGVYERFNNEFNKKDKQVSKNVEDEMILKQ